MCHPQKRHLWYDSQEKNVGKSAGKEAYKALLQDRDSGFSALLGGYRYSDGDFDDLGRSGYYWSSTEYSSSVAWDYLFDSSHKTLNRYYNGKSWVFSCRCLQD